MQPEAQSRMGLDSGPACCLSPVLLEGQSPRDKADSAAALWSRKLLEGKVGGARPGTDSPSMGGRCGAGRLSIAAVPGGERVPDTLFRAKGSCCLGHSTLPGSVPLPYQDVTLLSTLPLW